MASHRSNRVELDFIGSTGGFHWSTLCYSLVLLSALGLPGAESFCGTLVDQETAYSSALEYRYPRSFGRSYSYASPYKTNLNCKVLFKPYYDGDGVRLTFTNVDIEPPMYSGDYSSCRDKIIVYDGETTYSDQLTTVCGDRKPTVTSTGSSLLLVFTTDSVQRGEHYGYELSYERVDRGGSSSSSSLGPGTLAAIIIPTLCFYACIFFLVYRRCKYARDVRRNLAATGHTPEDIRVALTTVMEQASRQPLTSTTAGSNRADMNQILLEHMNASRDRRLGGGDSNPSRIRHPAGEHSGRASPYLAPEDSPDIHGSRHGSPGQYNPNGLTADHYSYNHHHGRHIEDDRRSHGSGRSSRSQGRRNPSPRPHSHRGDDPMAYTYYSDVDGATPAPDPTVHASAPSYDEVVPSDQRHVEPPPPSYEEAATGKYDP